MILNKKQAAYALEDDGNWRYFFHPGAFKIEEFNDPNRVWLQSGSFVYKFDQFETWFLQEIALNLRDKLLISYSLLCHGVYIHIRYTNWI